VRTACNGREALDLLADWQPGVILLDLMMPVLDGWGFRAEQLGDLELAAIPVILVSTISDVHQEARGLGVAAWMPKPCDLDHLLSTVGTLA
jgi:CheY-like chemotaxis protein